MGGILQNNRMRKFTQRLLSVVTWRITDMDSDFHPKNGMMRYRKELCRKG